MLPFHEIDDIGIHSVFFGQGENLCKSCKRECITSRQECLKCVNCHKNFHKSCTSGLEYPNSENFLCSTKCEMAIFPFSNFLFNELVKNDIMHSKPHSPDSSVQKNYTKGSKYDFKSDKNNFVSVDHFLGLRCSYLDPNQLSDVTLSTHPSDISIFHTNINSLTSNFNRIDDIFLECTRLPDILAFTETRLNENKSPSFNQNLLMNKFVDISFKVKMAFQSIISSWNEKRILIVYVA